MTEGPFVGRQHELGQLQAMLADVASAQGRLAMLVGEPGIGKTRTAPELATYAGQTGAQVLWGRCYEHSGAPPYWPWVQSIRSYVQTQSTDVLHADMGAGAADIAEIIPDLHTYLPELYPTPKLDNPDHARFRLFISIATFLQHASRRRPLVIVLDNLHWADTASLLLLEFLAPEIAAADCCCSGPIAMANCRGITPSPIRWAPWHGRSCFQRVVLSRLNREETEHFIALATGIVPPHNLVERLYRHTEGNPLFLSEWVRLLGAGRQPHAGTLGESQHDTQSHPREHTSGDWAASQSPLGHVQPATDPCRCHRPGI